MEKNQTISNADAVLNEGILDLYRNQDFLVKPKQMKNIKFSKDKIKIIFTDLNVLERTYNISESVNEMVTIIENKINNNTILLVNNGTIDVQESFPFNIKWNIKEDNLTIEISLK